MSADNISLKGQCPLQSLKVNCTFCSVSFFFVVLPESAEVTSKQPLCGAKSGLPRQLWLFAQRGQSSSHSSGQRQPDAHLQECWNHQRLKQPQPSTSLTLFTIVYTVIVLQLFTTETDLQRDVPFTFIIWTILAIIRLTHSQNRDLMELL